MRVVGVRPLATDPHPGLRDALAAAGVPGLALARWLATRPDLVTPEGAASLLEIAPAGALEPLPAAELTVRIETALGRPVTEAFRPFDLHPRRVDSLFQVHAARLPEGTPVRVRVRRMEPAVPPLRAALDAVGLPGRAILAGFAVWLERALDLEREALDLAAIAAEAAGTGAAAPEVLPALCGPGVLTLRDPPGADLRVWDGSDPELAAEAAVTSAYHLLRRGFEGRSFPVPADPGAVVVDRSGQVTWTGGPFASLPPLSRGRLKRYLLAVADGDADAAFDLLAEEVPVAGAAEEEVRRRLRQTVAWREEGATGAGGLTAELFAHMRGARQDGIAPSTPWLTLGQSLAGLAPTWRRMAPATDPVREALTRLTAAEMVDEVTRLAAPGPWGRRAGLTAAAVLSLPSQVDALLAGGESPSVRLRIAPPAPAPGDHRERVARLGWLAVAAALGLLWRPLGGATGLPPPAVEAVAAVLILVCGLRVLGHGRRRRGGP